MFLSGIFLVMAQVERMLGGIAESLKQERLQQNLSQQQVAEIAGISRRTLVDAETGNNISVQTLIKILLALNAEHRLASLLESPGISPVELSKLKGKMRQRATGSRSQSDNDTESGKTSTDDGWTW